MCIFCFFPPAPTQIKYGLKFFIDPQSVKYLGLSICARLRKKKENNNKKLKGHSNLSENRGGRIYTHFIDCVRFWLCTSCHRKMNTDDVVADIKSSLTKNKIRRYSEPGKRGRRVRCPEEILRDIRGLKLRQRVSLVLGDDLLKDELEHTIRNSTVNGVTRAETIRAYQDFLLPQVQPNFVNIGGGNVGGSGMVVLPINDIKGSNTLEYSLYERQVRVKLAAVYRLVDLLGWSESIFNHISVSFISYKLIVVLTVASCRASYMEHLRNK